ncbi:MAG: hypothetical protein HC853_08055 [Anaerolineae bacterium]|nr:hypothetical protein [Anaerolineae bacterium]
MATMRHLNLRSRRGEAYMIWTVLFLGFAITLMSLALDGMGLAVTYRRAVGLATTAAQAGAGALAEFGGGGVALRSDACQVALDTLQASMTHSLQHTKVTCQRQVNAVIVSVELKPLRVLGGPLALVIDRVQATAKASPKFGINHEE